MEKVEIKQEIVSEYSKEMSKTFGIDWSCEEVGNEGKICDTLQES